MRFAARIHNSSGQHHVEVSAGGRTTSMGIAPKASGPGSSLSGAELLMAALATCYCNDTYREAAKMHVEVTSVEVDCSADFESDGASASNVSYSVRISARAPEERIRALAAQVDGLAEIHNTLREAIPVKLARVEVVSA